MYGLAAARYRRRLVQTGFGRYGRRCGAGTGRPGTSPSFISGAAGIGKEAVGINFEQFYESYRGALIGIARNYTRRCPMFYDDLYSLLAEKLWRLYEGIGAETIRPDNVSGYIRRSLENQARDFVRSRYARGKHADIDAIQPPADPVDEYEQTDNRDLIRHLYDRAPDTLTKTIVREYPKYNSMSALGRSMGLHPEVVRRKLRRLAALV